MPNKYALLNDVKKIAGATNPSDDQLLQDALDWAEGTFESLCGSQFDQAIVINETPRRAYVDRYGWLTLVASERGPVSAVSAVSIRYPWEATWRSLTWSATDGLLLPAVDTVGPPRPNAWRVMLLPTAPRLVPTSEGDILVRWTYTGGYATAPARLRMVIERMALWKYKMREAPLGRVSMPSMGVTEVIPGLPDDLLSDIRRWENALVS